MICLLFYVFFFFWCSYMLMSSFCITSCGCSKITFPAMLFVLDGFCFVDLLSVYLFNLDYAILDLFVISCLVLYCDIILMLNFPVCCFIYYCCLYKSLAPNKELLLLGCICQKCILVSTICQ